MKFTKEQANEELVKQMTSKGEKLNLSRRSIDEMSEKLIAAIANEEMELSDFVSAVLPIFKTSDANVRNDVSHGIQDYKEHNAEHKDEHQEVNAQPSAIEERLKALEDENKRVKREAFERESVASLKKAIKAKGVKNDAWIETMLSKYSVAEDFNADTEADTYVDMYNAMMATYKPNATPSTPSGTIDNVTNDAIKAAAELVKGQSLLG